MECLAFSGTTFLPAMTTLRVYDTTPSGLPASWTWRHTGQLGDQSLSSALGFDTIKQPDLWVAADIGCEQARPGRSGSYYEASSQGRSGWGGARAGAKAAYRLSWFEESGSTESRPGDRPTRMRAEFQPACGASCVTYLVALGRDCRGPKVTDCKKCPLSDVCKKGLRRSTTTTKQGWHGDCCVIATLEWPRIFESLKMSPPDARNRRRRCAGGLEG